MSSGIVVTIGNLRSFYHLFLYYVDLTVIVELYC